MNIKDILEFEEALLHLSARGYIKKEEIPEFRIYRYNIMEARE